MSYREHAPPAALRPWLACVWEREGDGGEPVRVLPDGCIDILWTRGAGTSIVGPNSTAFLVPVAAGTRIVGARMAPGAAPALLGVGAQGLRDARVGLDAVWGDDGRAVAARLDASGDPVATMLDVVAARAGIKPDPLVRAAIARLDAPDAQVGALAGELFVSERQLRRRFVDAVGYGPKRLARVLRLDRALRAARRGDELARAALGAGYVDQAHFANECRALAGVSPSALV